MSSIFIGKKKQKELLANQVAIAIALGDFQDAKSHSALEFTNLVNSKIKDKNFKNCEGNYKLDEFALAKGFEIWPIECIPDVEEVTEVKKCLKSQYTENDKKRAKKSYLLLSKYQSKVLRVK